MIPVRVSFRYEFIPVPTCSSVFIYMIPVRNVIPVWVVPVRVHSGSRTGTKHSYRYEIWPHSVPVSCKGGTRFRSGRRWVSELTGTGSECMSIVNNAPKWLVRTRAHKKLCVIPVKWLPCKRGTKLDFVPECNLYRYHVNTPLVYIAAKWNTFTKQQLSGYSVQCRGLCAQISARPTVRIDRRQQISCYSIRLLFILLAGERETRKKQKSPVSPGQVVKELKWDHKVCWYSQLPLRQTRSGSALTVCLREVSTLERSPPWREKK